MNWQDSVNQKLGSARISDIASYIQLSHLPENHSPIDKFYSSTQGLLRISTPAFFESNSLIGPLILVGFVSATEDYFREIFSQLMHICPIAQTKFTDKKINMATALWYEKSSLARGAFEDYSFASAESIIKTCSAFLGHEFICAKNEDSIFVEFDKICELRHCIVHCNSTIAGKNAIKLGLKNDKNRAMDISIDYQRIQECGLICTCLVTSVNAELFELIVKRWVKDWPKMASWDPKNENALFKKIWSLFYSKKDSQNNSIDCVLSMTKCKNLAKISFQNRNPRR